MKSELRKDALELEKLFQIAVEKQFDLNVDQMNYQQTQMLAVATDFYWEGVQAAIALLSNQYQQTTNLSLK